MKRQGFLPIAQFSWLRPSPVIARDIRVERLLELAAESGPRLFILHDSRRGAAALVIPELVAETVQELDLPLDAPAWDVGLLSVLSEGQVTLDSQTPAPDAVRFAAWREAHAAIVVDRKRAPVGLFVPSVVNRRLAEASLVRERPTVHRLVREHIAVADLAGALIAIEREYTEFHSESLNFADPDPYVCRNHGKSHFVSECPCDVHPDASCGTRAMWR